MKKRRIATKTCLGTKVKNKTASVSKQCDGMPKNYSPRLRCHEAFAFEERKIVTLPKTLLEGRTLWAFVMCRFM